MANPALWGLILGTYPIPASGGTDPAAIFVNGLANVSPGNLRALWLPSSGDTTTTTSGGRLWTYNATIAGRTSVQGNGILVSFNGTSEYATTPDTNDMSMGNGTVDNPYSMVALANVTDTGNVRALFSKWNSTLTRREYLWRVNGDDKMAVFQFDESAVAQPNRTSNAAITMGGLHLFGFSQPGTGGATAMANLVQYQDAATVASTAAEAGSYFAMEGTAAIPTLAAQNEGAANWFQGSMGFFALYAAALSLAQHQQIKFLTNQYYRLAL